MAMAQDGAQLETFDDILHYLSTNGGSTRVRSLANQLQDKQEEASSSPQARRRRHIGPSRFALREKWKKKPGRRKARNDGGPEEADDVRRSQDQRHGVESPGRSTQPIGSERAKSNTPGMRESFADMILSWREQVPRTDTSFQLELFESDGSEDSEERNSIEDLRFTLSSLLLDEIASGKHEPLNTPTCRSVLEHERMSIYSKRKSVLSSSGEVPPCPGPLSPPLLAALDSAKAFSVVSPVDAGVFEHRLSKPRDLNKPLPPTPAHLSLGSPASPSSRSVSPLTFQSNAADIWATSSSQRQSRHMQHNAANFPPPTSSQCGSVHRPLSAAELEGSVDDGSSVAKHSRLSRPFSPFELQLYPLSGPADNESEEGEDVVTAELPAERHETVAAEPLKDPETSALVKEDVESRPRELATVNLMEDVSELRDRRLPEEPLKAPASRDDPRLEAPELAHPARRDNRDTYDASRPFQTPQLEEQRLKPDVYVPPRKKGDNARRGDPAAGLRLGQARSVLQYPPLAVPNSGYHEGRRNPPAALRVPQADRFLRAHAALSPSLEAPDSAFSFATTTFSVRDFAQGLRD